MLTLDVLLVHGMNQATCYHIHYLGILSLNIGTDCMFLAEKQSIIIHKLITIRMLSNTATTPITTAHLLPTGTYQDLTGQLTKTINSFVYCLNVMRLQTIYYLLLLRTMKNQCALFAQTYWFIIYPHSHSFLSINTMICRRFHYHLGYGESVSFPYHPRTQSMQLAHIVITKDGIVMITEYSNIRITNGSK